jgi:hypothetical protein
MDLRAQTSNLVSALAGGGTGPTGRPLIFASSRDEVNRGRKGIYGEYIHYQTWLDALTLAGLPAPDNPNHVLTSF